TWGAVFALEAVAQGELLDVAEIRVARLRDAAPVEVESVERHAEAVREPVDVAERVVVPTHASSELVGVAELAARVVDAEVVRDERLVEVTNHRERVLLGRERLPRGADPQVATERIGLVLVEERDARAQILHVESEVQARRRNLVERREVDTERGADALVGRELDADPLEGGAHAELGQDLRAVVERRRELVRAERSGRITALIGAFAGSVGQEHEADTE